MIEKHVRWIHIRSPFEKHNELSKNNEDINESDDVNWAAAEHTVKNEESVAFGIATQIGVIPIDDNDYNPFNIWIGECTFPISQYLMEIINEFPGVEACCPLSKYRFKVSIARMFRAGTVLSAITKRIKENAFPEIHP